MSVIFTSIYENRRYLQRKYTFSQHKRTAYGEHSRGTGKVDMFNYFPDDVLQVN